MRPRDTLLPLQPTSQTLREVRGAQGRREEEALGEQPEGTGQPPTVLAGGGEKREPCAGLSEEPSRSQKARDREEAPSPPSHLQAPKKLMDTRLGFSALPLNSRQSIIRNTLPEGQVPEMSFRLPPSKAHRSPSSCVPVRLRGLCAQGKPRERDF